MEDEIKKFASAIKKAADRWEIPLNKESATKIAAAIWSLTDEQLEAISHQDRSSHLVSD